MSNNETAAAMNEATQIRRSLDSLNRRYAAAQSKLAVQRNEIARLSQSLDNVTKQKMELISEIKWLKGER